jgi:hypothetical protein
MSRRAYGGGSWVGTEVQGEEEVEDGRVEAPGGRASGRVASAEGEDGCPALEILDDDSGSSE